MSENPTQKLRTARACEQCRTSKSRCIFKDNEQKVCQKCERTGNSCVVRLKARPMRSRAVRPCSTSVKHISPRVDEAEFTLDLPDTPAPNSIRDIEDLQEHHKHAFGDEDTEISNASSDERPRLIKQRKLNLQQAEQLLDSYRRSAVSFPFVSIPPDATVPKLSRTSPFLLLAILTAATSLDQPLRYQLDQEFRRILSAKVVAVGQKSLDFLQGLLVYIAWYPIHAKPKTNQAFMYLSLAISLAVDLGLDRDEVPGGNFSDINSYGLIENGCFTHAAKRAYLGAYYISSASVSPTPRLAEVRDARLAMGFQKPNEFRYRNLVDSQGISFIEGEGEQELKALLNLQRLLERIKVFQTDRQAEPDNPYYITAEMSVQMFQSELDEWRRATPDGIRNLAHIGLTERFADLSIYSHEIGFMRKPYRDHINEVISKANQTHLTHCLEACRVFFEYLLSIPESYYSGFNVVQWSLLVQSTLVLSRLTFAMASTRGWDPATTRANVPLSMYMDALCYRMQALSSSPSSSPTSVPRNPDVLCIFKMVLMSVKKSYESRVSKIVPQESGVEAIQANMFRLARGQCPIIDPTMKGFWNTVGSSYDGSWEVGTGYTPVSSDTDGGSGVGLGTRCPMGIETPLYFDIWNTMTGSWAEGGM